MELKNFKLGDVIRSRRIDLGITQFELSEGICGIATISRIESGIQNPTKLHLDALLQRLGISSERYYAITSSLDFKLQDLETQIKKCVVIEEPLKALELLDQLEALGNGDPLVQQFAIRERSIVGYYEDGRVRPYGDDEVICMLYQAIKKTIPTFSLSNIAQYLLTIEEIKIIVNIAVYYSERGQRENALDIYSSLQEYVHKHCMSMEEVSYVLPLIAYNYSRELGLEGQYEEALAISEEGRKCCVEYGKTMSLGELLTNQGYILHKLNQIPDCISKMIIAYYIFLGLEKYDNSNAVKEYLKTNFHYSID